MATIMQKFFKDLYFTKGGFSWLFFTNHQVEYIVSLSHYFFMSLTFFTQQAYCNTFESILHPSKISSI